MASHMCQTMVTSSAVKIQLLCSKLTTCAYSILLHYPTYSTRSHRMFVIDRSVSMHFCPWCFFFDGFVYRSTSMRGQDRKPLANSAGANRITPTANNRLGSVFSALYSFWLARQAAIDRNAQIGGVRRDAYSLIFFSGESSICIENDFASSPDELLTAALQYEPQVGTNFTRALERTQTIMDSHWSTERYGLILGEIAVPFLLYADTIRTFRTPVIIFLSDGEGHVRDEKIFDVCRSAVRQGFVKFWSPRLPSNDVDTRRPLSFHSVSFGRNTSSSSLRRMAQIALQVQNNAPQDPLRPAAAAIPSSYTEALDSVRRPFMLSIFGN